MHSTAMKNDAMKNDAHPLRFLSALTFARNEENEWNTRCTKARRKLTDKRNDILQFDGL